MVRFVVAAIALPLAGCPGGDANNAAECRADSECDDGDMCTLDSCFHGVCRNTDICNPEVDAPSVDPSTLSPIGNVRIKVNADGSGNLDAIFDDTLADETRAQADEIAARTGCFDEPSSAPLVPANAFSVGALDLYVLDVLALHSTFDGTAYGGTAGANAVTNGGAGATGELRAAGEGGEYRFHGEVTLPSSVVLLGPRDGNNNAVLGQNIAVQLGGVAGELLRARFSFLEGSSLRNISCMGDRSTGQIPITQAVYDALPSTGSVRLEAATVRFYSFDHAPIIGSTFAHVTRITTEPYAKP